MLVFPAAVFPAVQDYFSQKFKLAKSFEQQGDYTDAARLYLELYKADSTNENFFNAYIRAMKAQDKNSELIPFVENHIKHNPGTKNYILLGELYWKDGSPDKAEKAWKKAIELGKRNQDTYEELATTQLMLRLFQKAIETYQTGRKNLDAPDLFANRLSQLYSITGDYKNGTKEVLKLFAKTRNFALAEGRLSALAANPKAKEHIYKELKDKADNDLSFKLLYAWYLTTLNKFKEALAVYKELDDAMHARGREVYNFANDAIDAGQYDIAMEAYRWIISKGKSSSYSVPALYRLAKATELKFDATGKLDEKTAEGIIKQYRSIIRDYPATSTADECRYNIALLYKRIGHLKEALKELETLANVQYYSSYKVPAILMMGDIYFMLDDLDRARLSYKTIVDIYQKHKKQYYKALYSLAELEYFEGDLDSAIAHFTDLTQITDSDVSNDALGKITLIEANKNLNKALSLYAKGEKAEKQLKYNEALKFFEESAKAAKPENLYDLSLIKIASVYEKLGDYTKAKEKLTELIKEKPESIHIDYCLYSIGKINFEINQYDAAVENFTKLLRNYPHSIYNESARDYIRQIRNRMN